MRFDCELQDIYPTEDMLTLLRNDFLPQKVLPRSYAIDIFHGAILSPQGMRTLDVISSQPSDALANFQYYACGELPQEIREAFWTASPFELALVSLGMWRPYVVCCHLLLTRLGTLFVWFSVAENLNLVKSLSRAFLQCFRRKIRS